MKQVRQTFMENMRKKQRRERANALRNKNSDTGVTPVEGKSESLEILTSLNKTLNELIETKNPMTKDILLKILDVCKSLVMNACAEIQMSGLFKTIMGFLTAGVGNDFEVVAACFSILDTFEIEKEDSKMYLNEVYLAMYGEMAILMNQPWYDNYLSLMCNIAGSCPEARDTIAESQIAVKILGFLEDDKIDLIEDNSAPFIYISKFLCALVDPVNKKHIDANLC